MSRLESLGIGIEARLSRLEQKLTSDLSRAALGFALGIGVIAGGIASFIFVLVVLTRLFA